MAVDVAITEGYKDLNYFLDQPQNAGYPYSRRVDGGVIGLAHNQLQGLQGGQTSQYFHFTSGEHTELSAWLDQMVLSSDGLTIESIEVDAINEHEPGVGVVVGNNLIVSTQLGVGGEPKGDYAGFFLSETVNTCLMYDNRAMAQGVGGGIIFGGKYTTIGGLTAGGFIRVEKENAVDSEYGFDLLIGNRIDNAAIATQMMIAASDGRVRINQSMDSMDTTFASGFTGAGWKLDKTGAPGSYVYGLEVDNLRVRGSMNVYELILNKIRCTNGSFWISDAGEIDSVDSSVSYDKKILFDTSGDEAGVVFLVNDIIRCQQWDRDGIGASVKLYIAQVMAVGASDIEVNMLTGASTLIAAGDTIVRMGNTSTAARQNAIYLTASDSNNPFIEVLSGVDSQTIDASDKKVRLGNLTGITDATFGALGGYGLWSDNIYLTGSINANAGLIAGWTIVGNYIRKNYMPGQYDWLYMSHAGSGELPSGFGLVMGSSAAAGQVRNVHMGELHVKDTYNTIDTGKFGFEIIKKGAVSGYKHVVRICQNEAMIAGWNIDYDAIYSTSKHTADNYAASGLTLAADGGIHSKNFYVNADGDVGFRGKEIIYAYLQQSNTIILAHNGGEDSTNQSTYQLIKTITLGQYLGTDKNLRIRFDLKTDNATYAAWGELRKNGTPVGTPKNTTSTTYVLQTENGTSWSANDILTLWIKTEGTGVPLALNTVFTVCGDLATTYNEVTGAFS